MGSSNHFGSSRQIISEDYRRRLAVCVFEDLALVQTFASQRGLGCLRSKTLILKIDGDAQRQFKLSRDVPNLPRRVSLAAVEAQRQTQDHLSHVKLHAQFFEGSEELFPVRPAQSLERAYGQTQLVGHCDAHALRPNVEREDASSLRRTRTALAELF